MANDIDDEIANMRKRKLQLEGLCKFFNGVYSQLATANKQCKKANSACMQRFSDLLAKKTPMPEIYKDKDLIKLFEAREKARAQVKSIKKLADDKEPMLINLGKQFNLSVRYIKKKLKERKASKNPFKNPKVETRANNFIKEIDSMCEQLSRTRESIIRMPDL